MNKDTNNMKSKLIFAWIFGILLVLTVWFLGVYLLVFSKYGLCWWNYSSYGDVFTAVSALFSGLVLVAIVITFYVQIHSLKATSISISVQQFENNFFRLVEIQRQILMGFARSNMTGLGANHRSSLEILQEYYKELKEEYKKLKEIKSTLNRIEKAYDSMFSERREYLGHYFRHLYNIVKYIDAASVENKQLYANLLRAQLSTVEHLLLFYNCLSSYGVEKFKPLVEKYALFENMPKNTIDIELKDDSKHKDLYKPCAFKEKEN